MKLIALNGGDTQPGRLWFFSLFLLWLLLLCKTCEGCLIILSKIMTIFACIFLDLFVALCGEMICLNSNRIPMNKARF